MSFLYLSQGEGRDGRVAPACPSFDAKLSADAHSAPENMVRVRIWPAEFLPVVYSGPLG